MLDNSHDSQEGQGVWLWTIAAGLILFVMEFLLFAAMVPSDWERRVNQEELAELVQAVGPRSANAILDRAAGWYDAAFIQTHLQQYSYRLLLPDPHTPGYGLEPLASNPVWPWLRGRLDVIWGALAQALQRVAVLCSWWPFFVILFLAAWGDGWVRRRIRQQTTAIKRENVSLSFEPGAITHDPKNDNIYITGKHVTTGPGAQPVAIERTYVLRIVFQNYRPRVAYLDVYPGPARLSTEPPQPSSTPRGDPS